MGRSRDALMAFEESIHRARSFLTAYRQLHGKAGQVPRSKSDLLRGAVVFAVAAMDAYIRDVVTSHLAPVIARDIHKKRALPERLVKIIDGCMSTEDLIKAAYAKRPGSHVRSAVANKLAGRAFQNVRAIDDAFLLLGIDGMVGQAAVEMKWKQGQLKKMLRDVAKRRHQIVHQADLRQDNRKKRTPRRITVEFTEKAIATIEKFVRAMDGIVARRVVES